MFDTLKKPARIGVVGCGTIGAEVARYVDRGELPAILSGLCDVAPEKAEALATKLDRPPPLYDVERLVVHSDLVVECASAEAVDELVGLCLEHRRHLFVMSIGGLRAEHVRRFGESRLSLLIPSGAVAGMDGIAAHAAAGIERLTLVTRKPPRAFEGVGWLAAQGIEPGRITKETILFEGGAEDAVEKFPQNVNVCFTVKLASGNFTGLRVRVIADPGVERNIHEIHVESRLGKMYVLMQNNPSGTNPRTSMIACASAAATLEKFFSNIKRGT
ncbi:MAG: aspartate dehydrogenase domain-containing protein [bacterium]